MPNHVKNVWKIKHIPPDKMNYLLNKITTVYTTHESHDDGSPEIKVEERIIDFDLIIPEPRHILDCPKECRIKSAKDVHIEEDDGRPWFDWYTFHNEYWGTKWNAYDGYTKIGKTQITLVFSTAWTFPEPIALTLSSITEKLKCDLDLRFADEDIGHNLGRIIFNAEEGKLNMITKHDMSDPVRFAEYLWSKY